jgi:hypothetical protein
METDEFVMAEVGIGFQFLQRNSWSVAFANARRLRCLARPEYLTYTRNPQKVLPHPLNIQKS